MTAQHAEVAAALAWLERRGSARVREEMLTRYGITAPKAYGVPVGTVQQLAKRLGTDHALAAGLWATGWYEARLLAAMVDDPGLGTPAQMDRWARDFDNWGICDTVCFKLFDRTPHAWRKVELWARRRDEFVRRAAFALLASLALHDKGTGDDAFLAALGVIEQGATDDRNFVKKGVSWALRAVGRRNRSLHAAALALARRLAEADAPAPRWIGKDALRDLASPAARRQLAARRAAGKG